MPRDFARLIAITAIESRLGAAGLRFEKLDFAAGALEDVRNRQTDAREQLIDDAGNEKRNPARHEDRIVSK